MRILIAEDDTILTDGLSRALRKSGYAVDCVDSGTRADAALSAQSYDAVILDLGLPGISGFEVLKRLRSRAAKVPVLILTAADSVEQRVRGPRPGRRRLHGQAVLALGTGGAGARHRAPPRRLGDAAGQHRQPHLRPGRTGRARQRPQRRAVGARDRPAGDPDPARGTAGEQGADRRSPVRMGRRGEPQRDRGLCASPAQEDRGQRRGDQHRARAGLLPAAAGAPDEAPSA